MNEMMEQDEEKSNSKRITRNNKELIEIHKFEVGKKDGNCGTYEKAKRLTVDAMEVQASMLCTIFMKLIDKMKELMRRHDVMAFKVDDDQCNEKVNLETKFLSDFDESGIRDWNEQLWTGGVLSELFEID